MWLSDAFDAVHGGELFPHVIIVKGDYTLYKNIFQACYGDKTGLLNRFLPVVDHWHPVKGAIEKICGQGDAFIKPVRAA